ncbi:MAG: type II secretion system F family protein [Anaerotardibacter sp.]
MVLAVNAWVKYEQENRIEKVRDQIPNALQSMKTCFCVGYSLPQTLEQVGKETTGILSQLFNEAYGIMEAGGTAYQALDYLKKQASHSELVFLASALDIQHKTGSSMQQVLDIARDLVIEEIELERSLKTQTAQAKLSAQIVTIMPFVLIALFSFISPGFLNPFFESFIGLVMLTGSLFMQVVGVLMVRKMLQVKV